MNMEPVLYLAYDGSINADWIARYAIRMAGSSPVGRLILLHIRDGMLSAERLDGKLEHIAHECLAVKVDLEVLSLPLKGDVFTTLVAAIPAGDEVYCICGARATSRGRGFLTGTVSQHLLRTRRFNTLALRVVNPGQLGCPANVIFPLSGHPRKFRAAMPFLLLLAPCIKKLTVLRIMTVNTLLYRYLSAHRVRTILGEGTDYVREVMAEIRAEAGRYSFRLDDHILISADWAREILVQAGKARSGLLLLGASDRFIQSRFYYGSKIERILLNTPCDVGIYRKI